MLSNDTNITAPGWTFAEPEQATNSELTNLYNWQKANKLSLNIAKTEFIVVSSRHKLLAENCSEREQGWKIQEHMNTAALWGATQNASFQSHYVTKT